MKRSIISIRIVCSLLLFITCTNNTRELIRQYPQKATDATRTCAEQAGAFALEAQLTIANNFFKSGEYQKAITSYLQAIDLQPELVSAHYNLGLAYLAISDLNNAQNSLLRAVELDPHHARALYFLGHTYQQQNKLETALEYYGDAIVIDPDYFDAHLNKARTLSKLQRIHDSIKSYEIAVHLHPADLGANFELAYLYNRTGNLENSMHYYRRAVDISPDHIETNCNLAHALRYAGHMEDAIASYHQVLEKAPHHAHAHCGIAECYLATGDLTSGFKHFEYRFERMQDTRRMKEQQWDGKADLHGKTILVRAEFGQGDTIQFARYLPLLKERGARVILEVQHTLVSLFTHAPYVDQVLMVTDPPEQLPTFDYQIPIMSLPRVFNTTLETIPADVPYIYSDKTLDAHWKEQLKDDTNFKIGICWEGSIYYEQFKSPYSRKAIPLEAFAPLAQLPGVTLYSLQKMNGTDQLYSLPTDMRVHDFGSDFDHTNGRFMDTASVVQQMDLIVTADTSIAHLSGALGVRTWVLLPYVADWRWLKHRTDSPWYPTMKLFRQHAPQDWQSVLHAVVTELEATLSLNASNMSPLAEVSIGELIDKMTILEIKSERIKDQEKLRNVHNEQQALKKVFDAHISQERRTQELFDLISELKTINETLWGIEDSIRDKEALQEFDDQFIQLARSVYFTNDERGRVKRALNDLLGSRLVEEKAYKAYK